MAFTSFLDPILNPLLSSVGVLGFIIVISLVISLITVLVYKYTTDQILMKNLKEELTKMQKEAKTHVNDQKRAMAIHKEMFSKQMSMMKHQMVSTAITILPVIILISWMTANLAFAPIGVSEQFTVTVSFDDYIGNAELFVPAGMTIVDSAVKEISKKVDWRLSGDAGEYLLEWQVDSRSYTKDVIIGSKEYSEQIRKVDDGIVKQIRLNYKPQKILNLLGWRLGWLGSYIIFALIFSLVLRKLLRVY